MFFVFDGVFIAGAGRPKRERTGLGELHLKLNGARVTTSHYSFERVNTSYGLRLSSVADSKTRLCNSVPSHSYVTQFQIAFV